MKIIIDDKNYYNDEISLNILMENKPILNNKVIYVKRKTISIINEEFYFGSFKDSIGFTKFLSSAFTCHLEDSMLILNSFIEKNIGFIKNLKKIRSDVNKLGYVKRVVTSNFQVIAFNQINPQSKNNLLINKALVIIFVEYLSNENMFLLILLIDNITKIVRNLEVLKVSKYI